jgi:hypothetical protein
MRIEDIPEDIEWHPLPDEADNCYLVIIPGRNPIRAFIDPAKGVEALIADILDPPEPPPPRRLVLRRTIIERLAAADLLDEAEAALLKAPALTRWRWNTAGDSVYFDDPETVSFLEAIGADPAEILAP